MYSGTFRWTEIKDKILLREVRFVEPYQFKAGSKESGQAWSEVAGAVNQYEGFKVMLGAQEVSNTDSKNCLVITRQK